MPDFWSKLFPLRLRQLFNIDLSRLRSIKAFNFIYHKEDHRKVYIDKRTLIINIADLQGKERKELLAKAKTLHDCVGSILLPGTRDDIEDLIRVERDSTVSEDIAYFQEIVPAADSRLLRACFYLKSRHDAKQEVSQLKRDISRLYGPRGTNLANICSAGYFDKWLRPLFEQLKKREPSLQHAKDKFLTVYKDIVEKQPWTIFVSYAKTVDEIKMEILAKLTYGSKFVYIHALSERNVAKAKQAAAEFNKEYSETTTNIIEEPGRVRIKVLMNDAKANDQDIVCS